MKYLQLFIICFISLTLIKPDPEPLDTINLNLNIPYEKPDGIQGNKRKEISDYQASAHGNNGYENGYRYINNGFKDIGSKNGYLKKYGRYSRYRKYGRKAPTPASTITPAPKITPAPTANPAPTAAPAPTTTPASETDCKKCESVVEGQICGQDESDPFYLNCSECCSTSSSSSQCVRWRCTFGVRMCMGQCPKPSSAPTPASTITPAPKITPAPTANPAPTATPVPTTTPASETDCKKCESVVERQICGLDENDPFYLNCSECCSTSSSSSQCVTWRCTFGERTCMEQCPKPSSATTPASSITPASTITSAPIANRAPTAASAPTITHASGTTPTPITSPAPTTTPTPAPTTDYCRIHPQHTMCLYSGPSAECAAKTLKREITSPADQQALVDKHNELRRRVANGLETQGRPGPQPAASDMLLMVWDDELATIAQRWADQCPPRGPPTPPFPLPHDPNGARDTNEGYVGQNIGTSTSTAQISDSDISAFNVQRFEEMYQEVQNFSRNSIDPWEPSSRDRKTTTHYTQMVWASSRKIGCGYVYYDKGASLSWRWEVMVFCNYYEGANTHGETMYKPGRACSACPAEYPTCSDGLCTT